MDSLRIGGEWCTDGETLKNHVTDFFRNLYSEPESSQPIQFSTVGMPRFSDSARNTLTKRITAAEVKGVLDSMAPLKSPGPDGISAVFFQQLWEVVGSSLTRFVRQVFE